MLFRSREVICLHLYLHLMAKESRTIAKYAFVDSSSQHPSQSGVCPHRTPSMETTLVQQGTCIEPEHHRSTADYMAESKLTSSIVRDNNGCDEPVYSLSNSDLSNSNALLKGRAVGRSCTLCGQPSMTLRS